MPCSNINWTKHAFFPNFHKISKWRKIPESITGAPPASGIFTLRLELVVSKMRAVTVRVDIGSWFLAV